MNNLGILYFSSTGNSLYISKKIKQRLGGEIIYIPSYSGDGSEFEKVIIVTPVFSFGMPVPVLRLFSALSKNCAIIGVLNYGGMSGGADKLFYDYAKARGLNIMGVFKLKMPENFTLVMSPPKFFINRLLKTADKRIDAVVDDMENGKLRIPKRKRTKEATYLKNKDRWYLIGKRFSVTDKCVKCLKCVSVCPSGNISLTDGKIVFADKCEACLGCFHRCPQRAIIYRNKDNKKRYVNPLVNENEIGKNL